MHKICAFFGHRDVVLSGYYEHVLEKVCRKLIDEAVKLAEKLKKKVINIAELEL